MGRLNCRIDKVGGVVETNRPDRKNFLYQVRHCTALHCSWWCVGLAEIDYAHFSSMLVMSALCPVQSTIKQGDLLLNRLQKLGRIINI